MTTTADEHPKLDPFAFPATTDSRFILLMLAVVGATTYVYGWISLKLPAMREALTSTAERCSAAAEETNAAIGAALSGKLDNLSPTYSECIADVQIQGALWSLSGLPLLVLVTGFLYWWIPRRIARRRNLVALDPEDAAEVLEAVRESSRAMGLRTMPAFLGAPGTRSTGALAFGLPGQRTVALNNGLVTLFYLQPRRFDAIVRHELAHIRNADIDKAYLTVSASLAFIVVGLVPFALSLLGEPIEDVLGFGIRTAGLALLVALSAAAVLRARECYADVRAAQSPAAAEALDEIFAAAPPVHESKWRRPLRLHLAPPERLSILRDPRPLFRAEALEFVAAGIAVAVVVPRIVTVASGLAVRQGQSVTAPFVGALLLTPLLAGIVGLVIWRAAYASFAARTPPPRFARLAFALGAGMAIGSLLSFDAYEASFFDPLGLLTVNIAWAVLVGGVVYGFMRWQAATCTVWLGASGGRPPSRRAFLIGFAVLCLVFLAAMTVLLFTQVTAAAMSEAVGNGVLGGIAAVVIALGIGLFLVVTNLPLLSASALIALWAYPLLVSGQRALGRTLLAGAVGGIVYVVVASIIRSQFDALPDVIRKSDDAILQLQQNSTNASVLLQAAVAAFVAWRARSMKLAHALLAAFVCGCVSVGGFITINANSVDLSFVISTYVQMVCTGGLAAIVTGGIAARLSSRAGAHLDPRLVPV